MATVLCLQCLYILEETFTQGVAEGLSVLEHIFKFPRCSNQLWVLNSILRLWDLGFLPLWLRCWCRSRFLLRFLIHQVLYEVPGDSLLQD